MKKLMFLFSFVLFAGMLTAQSKSCSKTCAKKCSKKTAKTVSAEMPDDTKVASALAQADIAAEADEAIEKRVCADSGTVSFYKKSECAKSGKISFDQVEFDAESQAFVNVSPKDAMEEVEGTAVKAAMSESDVEVVPTEGAAKKACTKGSKKSCAKSCKKKAQEQ